MLDELAHWTLPLKIPLPAVIDYTINVAQVEHKYSNRVAR